MEEKKKEVQTNRQESSVSQKVKKWYRDLPNKKQYVELITALLSIPVLLTVIILNLNNLRGDKNKGTQDNRGGSVTIIPIEVDKKDASPAPTQTPQTKECKKEVGPVSILYPEENQTVTNDPVCVDISYKTGDYCGVVWSYRINAGSWSDFTDKSICLYNLPSGDKKFELRVKSIASSDEEVFQRNFIYKSSTSPTTTATDSAQ